MAKIQNSSAQRNCSIDMFRLLFAVYVVAIHSTPAFLDNFPFLSLTISSALRFAVPFFFMVSGYYFFKNANNVTFKYMFTYVKRIVIIYFFWSCLYFVINFIKWGHTSIVGFAIDCIYSVFLTGSYYHLWYFPALIFAVCVSALLCRFGCKKLLFGFSIVMYPLCYLISEYQIFSGFPALSVVEKAVSLLQPMATGLFYFGCGQLIEFCYDKWSSSKKSNSLVYVLPISVILWFILIWIDDFFALSLELLIILGIYINVGMTVLVLLLKPMEKNVVAAKKCRYLANFIYYSHPLYHYILELFNNNWLHLSDCWKFPITVILTVASGLLLYRMNNKHINRFIC